jgi:pyridoxal phosphate enzyme (YggS family)
MTIPERLKYLAGTVPASVTIVAVSKTMDPGMIMEAYNAGQRIFGENKVQELISKQPLLPSDIRWHFIGHLQRNKVRFIIPFIHLIHSVDSLRLLEEINKEAAIAGRIIGCLLQFHISGEESKYGLDFREACLLLESSEFSEMKNITLNGVMGMASFTDDEARIRTEFRQLRKYFDMLKESRFVSVPGFKEISMGMSGDYPVAIEEGSTIIRIGTAIFGDRT